MNITEVAIKEWEKENLQMEATLVKNGWIKVEEDFWKNPENNEHYNFIMSYRIYCLKLIEKAGYTKINVFLKYKYKDFISDPSYINFFLLNNNIYSYNEVYEKVMNHRHFDDTYELFYKLKNKLKEHLNNIKNEYNYIIDYSQDKIIYEVS